MVHETQEPGLDLRSEELWAASEQGGRARPTSQTRSSWLLLESVRVCEQSSWLGGSEDEPDLVVEAKKKDGVKSHPPQVW